MMRLIEQPTGTGDLYEHGQLRGAVHYSLNVYQQYDEGGRTRHRPTLLAAAST